MRRSIILTGCFDPITETELQKIKTYLHRSDISKVLISVSGEGILSVEARIRLLKLAVRPYRRIKIVSLHRNKETIDITDKDAEKEVQSGVFRKAARGIKKELLVNGYYFNEIVSNRCKASRAAHSRSVAELCKTLARMHRLDENKAWQIGMLHDITKKWDDDKARPIVERYYPEMIAYSEKVWHSYTAPIFLYQEMGVRDHQILHAIECHTIGNGSGSYDHIIYIADKCEPLRGYDVSVQLGIASKSLAKAAAYGLNESKRYIYEKEGVHV